MLKKLFTLLTLSWAAGAMAQTPDSLKLEQLQEVVVKGVRAQQDAPYATTEIKKQELQARQARNCLSFSHRHPA